MLKTNIRTYRRSFFIIAGMLLASILPAPTYAADSASLQLALVAPDPVRASEDITFQVIAVNNGTETWGKENYFFEVQIYNAQKQYLIKTSRILGDKDVAQGESVLSYIPFNVPQDYSGSYFYKVFLTHKDQRILEGDWLPFSVLGIPSQKQKLKPIALGGNAILSLRTFNTDEKKDTLNTSVNSVGQIYGQSMLLNVNALTTRPNHTKISQMLFAFYHHGFTLNFGDVQPNFSPLSLGNSGARGLWLQVPYGKVQTEIVSAQTVFKVAGSSVPAQTGTFARYLLGIQEKVSLPKNVTVGADYTRVFDDKNSLSDNPKDASFRGPDPKEAKNQVFSGQVAWKFLNQKMALEGNFATSDFEENTLSTVLNTVSQKGQAYRVGGAYKDSRYSAKAAFQRTDIDFKALAAPGATADKQTIDFGLGTLQPLGITTLGLNLTGNQVSDNLKDDPKKNTTTQRTLTANSSWSLPRGWPGVSVTYAINVGRDKSKTAVDNETQTVGGTLLQSISKKVNLSVGFQQSRFIDHLGKSANLVTRTENLSLTSGIGPQINISLGGTLARTDSEKVGSTAAGSLISNSYTASLNWNILKEKMTAQIFGTWNTRSGSSSGTNQDTKDRSGNIELNYQLLKKLAINFGATYNKNENFITPSLSAEETILSSRLTYTF